MHLHIVLHMERHTKPMSIRAGQTERGGSDTQLRRLFRPVPAVTVIDRAQRAPCRDGLPMPEPNDTYGAALVRDGGEIRRTKEAAVETRQARIGTGGGSKHGDANPRRPQRDRNGSA